MTRGVRAGSSCRSTFIAPRSLNAPPVCRFSHLKKTSQPVRASKAAERMTGVRRMCGAMRAAAATTSPNTGMRGLTGAPSLFMKGGGDEVLSVVREFANGFLDVRERLVLALLGESADDSGRPATRQLLESA